MNTLTHGQNASGNDSAPRSRASEEVARAAQVNTGREEPPSARLEPSAREIPHRQEPPRDNSRASAAAAEKRVQTIIPMGSDDASDMPGTEGEQLTPLFPPSVATEYRARWVVVQQSFVDDPRRAVQQGDELVTQVIRNLAETFSKERNALEGRFDESDNASTEMLRVALRRYRSLFERLLSF